MLVFAVARVLTVRTLFTTRVVCELHVPRSPLQWIVEHNSERIGARSSAEVRVCHRSGDRHVDGVNARVVAPQRVSMRHNVRRSVAPLRVARARAR
eukprot:11166053-Lingulodinium_polyedra.AAC.1